MENEKRSICEALMSLCGDDGSFKVVESDEIIEKLPDSKMTKLQLSAVIRDLKERELIKVKYFTPDEYCLQVMPKMESELRPPVVVPPIVVQEVPTAPDAQGQAVSVGGVALQAQSTPQSAAVSKPVSSSRRMAKKAASESAPQKTERKWTMFWFAFFGSFMGGAVVAAIAIVIQKFVF